MNERLNDDYNDNDDDDVVVVSAVANVVVAAVTYFQVAVYLLDPTGCLPSRNGFFVKYYPTIVAALIAVSILFGVVLLVAVAVAPELQI